MTRTFAIAAVAALMCASTALAAEDAQKPAAGGADTSTGAKEQSSAPPGSEAQEDLTLVVLVQIVGYVTWRSRKAERVMDGVPRVLVRHGHVNDRVMKEEQITRGELIEALRRESHTALTDRSLLGVEFTPMGRPLPLPSRLTLPQLAQLPAGHLPSASRIT
jgi:hypothetical protein